MSEPVADPVTPAVEAARGRYVEAQQRLRATCESLLDVAARSQRAADVGIAHVQAGGRVADIPVRAQLAELVADIRSANDAFDEARIQTRLWTIVLAAEEGCSNAEIARLFGVSRQYVSKLLKDHPEITIGGDPR